MKKVNIPYLLTYILVIVILIIISTIISFFGTLTDNNWVFVLVLLCSLIMVLWIVLVPMIAPSVFRNIAYRKLTNSGFKIEKVYRNFTYSLLIDITGGMVAKIYSFNPITPYVFSAKRIQKIWIVESKRPYDNHIGVVGVRLIVDNKTEIFDTYNQSVNKTGAKIYLPPNHPNIISAKQKAHNIACELNQAWRSAQFK